MAAASNNTMSVDDIIEHFNGAMASPSATENTIEIARNTISYLTFLKNENANKPWLVLQSSLDWKDRLKGEYQQLQDRRNKLHTALIKNAAGTIQFKGNTPISLLIQQEEFMDAYLNILEMRAEYEGIEL